MNDRDPIVCTLGESDLRQRLDEIATLGADSLLDHESKDGVHTLRFRREEGTRRRLEQIVAAESKCCSFLELNISECDGDLVLTVAAPVDGRAVADELARVFLAKR